MKIKFYSKNSYAWKLEKTTHFNSKSKEDQTIHTMLTVDSEYQSKINESNTIITVQILDKIFEHPNLGKNLLPSWTGESAISETLGFKEELAKYPKKKDRRLIVHLIIFFSPTDICALFKSVDIQKRIMEQLDQTKRIKIKTNYPIYTGLKVKDNEGFERHLFLRVHDAAGLMNRCSLKELCSNLNIQMNAKDLLTPEDKQQMLLTYKNKHENFKEYARGDSLVLSNIFPAYERLFDEIANEMGLNPIQTGHTLGSNVAKITERIIERNLKKKTNLSEKMILDKKNSKMTNKKQSIDNLIEFILTLNQEATATYLAQEVKYTSQLLSLVDGGRCKNERPRDVNVEGLLVDIDISGCYANGLLNQVYPIGIPTILKFHKAQLQHRITLKQFLKSKLGKNLKEGLWYARISTIESLSFDQDIFLSKIPPEKITSSSTEDLDQDESTEVLGTFILLTKEIKYAVLTHDLLQILKETATDKEWNELQNKIVIDALIFYPESLECETLEDWLEHYTNSEGTIKNWVDPKFISHEKDDRPRYWIGLPMNEDWIDVLLGKRKNYSKSDPKNTGYKLLCNSSYGIQASPYFDVANVVVANNITARARAVSWLMSKSLGIYQSITDGGIFNLNVVNFWKDVKPGLNTLTNINEIDKLSKSTASRISKIPLGNYQWKFFGVDEKGNTILTKDNEIIKGKKEEWQFIDNLAWQHICNFFPGNIDILKNKGLNIKSYDNFSKKVISEEIQGLFSLETKDIYIKVSFQSQANYRLVHPTGEIIIKARGYEIDKEVYLDPYGKEPCSVIPIKDCLERIAKDESIPPYQPIYQPIILKIKQWNKPSQLIKDNNLLPGDTTSKRSFLRPISLSMFRWQTWDQYQIWSKRHEKYREEYGYGVEAYFLNPDKSVRYKEAINSIQDAIDAGKNWVSEVNIPPKNIQHPYSQD